MFSSDRDTLRQTFFAAWKKHKSNLPLEPIEAQLIELILLHPEYQTILDNPEQYQAANFSEHNPFLHLSLHLAVREQINTNRPVGIKIIYENLCRKFQDKHVVEHKMLECLGQVLWDAQREGKMADEKIYLEKLKNHV